MSRVHGAFIGLALLGGLAMVVISCVAFAVQQYGAGAMVLGDSTICFGSAWLVRSVSS